MAGWFGERVALSTDIGLLRAAVAALVRSQNTSPEAISPGLPMRPIGTIPLSRFILESE